MFNLAKIFLKEHNDLIVTKADEGNTTVFLNKVQHMSKTKTLLNEESTYKILDKVPNNSTKGK